MENPKATNRIGWQRVEPRGFQAFERGWKRIAHVRILNTPGDYGVYEEANVSLWIYSTVI